MEKISSIVHKVLYGLTFCVVLPFLLWLWAYGIDGSILPIVPFAKPVGYLLFLIGILGLVAGMHNLFFIGKGLPMNAFPPTFYVTKGVYAVTKHPIYVGACVMLFGIGIICASPSICWVISPVFSLGCVALVVGFEKQHILSIYKTTHQTWLSWPQASNNLLQMRNKFAVFVYLFLPWIVLYKMASAFTLSYNHYNTRLMVEYFSAIPLFTPFYTVVYLQVVLIPFFAKTHQQLRQFVVQSTIALILGFGLMFLLPLVCIQLPFHTNEIGAWLLGVERKWDSIAGAFPSFHVIWSLLAYSFYAKRYPKAKVFFLGISVLTILACYTTGMHGLLDLVSGCLVYSITIFYKRIWCKVQQTSERLANSWQEWHIGGVRIINHVFYAGASGLIAGLIAFLFVPQPEILLIIAFCTLGGAALWAQFVEGSKTLLRPFGYYGSILGGMFSLVLIASTTRYSFWYLCGVIAMLAPAIQAVGRLRCLVQGCCHGRLTQAIYGIVVTDLHSRVCQISGLKGQPIHNTQLYSILSNLVLQLILVKLFTIGASVTFLTGIYFIGNGLSRFVEESYRGEAQTKVIYKLRLYQWLAIAFVLIGVVFTCVPSAERLVILKPEVISYMATSLCIGCFGAFALSIDFPHSKRRFSRLSG